MADVLSYTVIDFPFLSNLLHFCAFCFFANEDKGTLKSKEIICAILKYHLKIVHFFVSKSGVFGRRKETIRHRNKISKACLRKNMVMKSLII